MKGFVLKVTTTIKYYKLNFNSNSFPGLIVLVSLFLSNSKNVASKAIIQETAPCIDQQNDVLLPVFGECSQFYGCKNGKAILMNCMEGLYFDPESKNCTDDYSKSDCIQKQSLSSTMSNNSKVKPSETPEIPKYICLGKAIGTVVHSRTNCSEYYSCVSSTPKLKACDMQMHFDSYSQKCIPLERSNCVVKPKAQVTTTRKPELIEIVCKGKFDGEKFPVPGNCSKYFECFGHKAYEKSCGEKHFYSISRTCIDPEVSECFEGNVRVITMSTESNGVGDMNYEGNTFVDQRKDLKDFDDDVLLVLMACLGQLIYKFYKALFNF